MNTLLTGKRRKATISVPSTNGTTISSSDINDLIVGHQGFVEVVARNVLKDCDRPKGIDFGDLCSEGTLGMIQAAPRFRHGRGNTFLTFVGWRVEGAMIDYIRRESKVSRGVMRTSRREDQLVLDFVEIHGRLPELHEIAKGLGMKPKRYVEFLAKKKQGYTPRYPLSLEDLIVVDTEQPSVNFNFAEEIDARLRNQNLRRTVVALPARLRKIVSLYYWRDLTMKNVGSELGCNESRISQLHTQAINKLRQSMNLHVQ